jgi:hypothetical protein
MVLKTEISEATKLCKKRALKMREFDIFDAELTTCMSP